MAGSIASKPFMAVGIIPGAYALTVMFHGPSSPARVRLSWATADLAAAYAAEPTLGTIAANEAALMIRPDRWAFMIGITARHILKVPPTLTAKHRSQASSLRSSTRPSTKMPALLTS